MLYDGEKDALKSTNGGNQWSLAFFPLNLICVADACKNHILSALNI